MFDLKFPSIPPLLQWNKIFFLQSPFFPKIPKTFLKIRIFNKSKVIYLLSMTPIQPSTAWLKSLDSAITKFYWKNKTPRIKLSTLQKPKSLGGLDAPNFTPYCLANHLQYIHRWTHPNQSDITWLDLEQNLYGNFQIADLPFFTQTIKKHSCFKSPTISSSLTAWWKFHNITNTKLSHLKLTPIWNNPDFTCNNKKTQFQFLEK